MKYRQIKTCSECPCVKRARLYTKDSWDEVEKLSCGLTQPPRVSDGYHEWYDKDPPPRWCPLRAIKSGPVIPLRKKRQ